MLTTGSGSQGQGGGNSTEKFGDEGDKTVDCRVVLSRTRKDTCYTDKRGQFIVHDIVPTADPGESEGRLMGYAYEITHPNMPGLVKIGMY